MRQRNNTKMITLRIPDGLHEYLMLMCSLEETTLSNMVRSLLEHQAKTHRRTNSIE